jgi:hypothetical protein
VRSGKHSAASAGSDEVGFRRRANGIEPPADVNLSVAFATEVARTGRICSLGVPFEYRQLGIPALNDKPMNRIIGYRATDLTSEFIEGRHAVALPSYTCMKVRIMLACAFVLSVSYTPHLHLSFSGCLCHRSPTLEPDGCFASARLFQPWKRDRSPAFQASRSPGVLRSQSGCLGRSGLERFSKGGLCSGGAPVRRLSLRTILRPKIGNVLSGGLPVRSIPAEIDHVPIARNMRVQ